MLQACSSRNDEEVKKSFEENVGYRCYKTFKQSLGQCSGVSLKKDGKLRFCIDLRKLNAQMVQDTYSLPCIDKTIDLLHGAV